MLKNTVLGALENPEKSSSNFNGMRSIICSVGEYFILFQCSECMDVQKKMIEKDRCIHKKTKTAVIEFICCDNCLINNKKMKKAAQLHGQQSPVSKRFKRGDDNKKLFYCKRGVILSLCTACKVCFYSTLF